MSYVLELRPLDDEPLSIDAYKRRFRDLGFDLHPSLRHPSERPEVKARHINELWGPVTGGLSVIAWEKEKCGVTALSWLDSVVYDREHMAESVARTIRELLAIARQVNARLYDLGRPVTEKNLQATVDRYLRYLRIAGGLFGQARPRDDKASRSSEGAST